MMEKGEIVEERENSNCDLNVKLVSMESSVNSCQDQKKLLSVFPAEVWGMILSCKNVTDPEDYNKIIQASPAWEQFLVNGGATWSMTKTNIWQVRGYQRLPATGDELSIKNRELVISATDSPYRNQEMMDKFLKKHGSQIWYCTLGISARFNTKVDCYRKLRQILLLMPKLKGLYIHFGPPLNHPSDAWEENPSGPTSDNLQGTNWWYLRNPKMDDEFGLEKEISGKPLPKLKRLIFLGCTDVPDFLKRALTSAYGSQGAKIIERDNPEIPYPIKPVAEEEGRRSETQNTSGVTVVSRRSVEVPLLVFHLVD